MAINASVRINEELYDRIKTISKSKQLSISDFIRNAVEHVLQIEEQGIEQRVTDIEQNAFDVLQTQLKLLHDQIQAKDDNTEQLLAQLQQKDEQISQLHQIVAMSQSHTNELTQQLDRAHLQLEDLRQKRPWWRRWLWARA